LYQRFFFFFLSILKSFEESLFQRLDGTRKGLQKGFEIILEFFGLEGIQIMKSYCAKSQGTNKIFYDEFFTRRVQLKQN